MAELTPNARALQRADALKVANQRRVETKHVRDEIRALSKEDGCHWVATLLEAHDARVQHIKIGWLLTSIRKIGRGQTATLVRVAGIQTYDRHVGQLTERQIRVLVECLRTWDLFPGSDRARRNGSRKR